MNQTILTSVTSKYEQTLYYLYFYFYFKIIILLVNSILKKYKTSSIIITHDIKCALKTANRILMLKDGEVYMEGTIASFEKSTDPFIQSFFN